MSSKLKKNIDIIELFKLPNLGNSTTVRLLRVDKLPFKVIIKNNYLWFLLYGRILVKIEFVHDSWLSNKETILLIRRSELKELNNKINKKIVISQMGENLYIFRRTNELEG